MPRPLFEARVLPPPVGFELTFLELQYVSGLLLDG